MPKRSRFEICADVLRVIKNGEERITPIMYRCNLSYKPVREILDFLVQQEFITVTEKGKTTIYQITSKGIEVLNYYTKTEQLIYL